MKYSLAIVLSVIAIIHGAAIEGPTQSVVSPLSLFKSANEYQKLLTELQTDKNVKLGEVRTAVSTVLKDSSAETLKQIEKNADTILALDDVVRQVIFNEPLGVCNINLRNQINSITEFSGFESSNCVARYDNSVQAELKIAYEFLRKYEGTNGDVQQIVVRSFIRGNAFTKPEEIEDRFKEQYAARSEEWEKIRPEIEKFVKDLSETIADFNKSLNGCFKVVHTKLEPQYVRLNEDIAICREYESTPAPF